MALASHGMRLGFYMGYAPPGTNPLEPIALAQEAERLGYDSAWAAEAWGTDCVTVLSWLGATTERIKLGSGDHADPRAHAGEHGDDGDDARPPLGRPLPPRARHVGAAGRRGLARRSRGESRSRRRASTSRSCARRSGASSSSTTASTTTSRTANGNGLGKPLKIMARPLRADIPIYLAAMGPKAVAQAFEIADGWLPIFWSPEKARDVFGDVHRRARATGFDIAADRARDPDRRRRGRPRVPEAVLRALHRRHGRARQELLQRPRQPVRLRGRRRSEIQDLYLDGNKRDAAAAVPDAFIDEVALVGPKERIAERLEAWRESGATSLLVSTQQPEALRALAEIAL